jgi:uncharacterized membrane protein HdeD (DUF308 family)
MPLLFLNVIIGLQVGLQVERERKGPPMLYTQVREAAQQVTSLWWTFLLAGLGWFVVSIVVLQLNLTSAGTVGILLGVIFLVSALEEFLTASVGVWGWARALLGVFFLVAAIWSFADPLGTFASIADALGFLLIFKGTLDIVTSITSQPANPVWWLGLIAGLFELGLGFWAAQQYFPARAALLLLWIGFYALFRGIYSIVLAF